MSNKIELFLDSGAHSIYERLIKKEGKRDYNYADTQVILGLCKFLWEYLQENQSRFEVAVNVDVIFNAKMTWRVQKSGR